MITLDQYDNPFLAAKDFEAHLAEFTGAPFAITTDCCSHAIEIALRCFPPVSAVTIPSRTYLSVPMIMHKLDIDYHWIDQDWRGEYQIGGTNIWDSARLLSHGMYRAGQIQCLSFGRTKPLELGRGGCILTDDADFYQRANRMRYDGRDVLKFSPWALQQTFEVGYHYFLRAEECVDGLNLLLQGNFTPQIDAYYNYPDLKTITIT